MATALEDLLARHVETGTIQGAVALLERGDDVTVAAVGVASDDGRPMAADAIMRIQSMTKVAVRLVGRTGHRLLRRQGWHRRHLVHPGGAGGANVAIAR